MVLVKFHWYKNWRKVGNLLQIWKVVYTQKHQKKNEFLRHVNESNTSDERLNHFFCCLTFQHLFDTEIKELK